MIPFAGRGERRETRDERPMAEALATLKRRLVDVHNLGRAEALLDWDQQTQMPPGGVGARAEQKATLTRLAHDLLVADETRAALEEAEAAAGSLPSEGDDASLIRVARRD